ncbi:hypothetical protein [Parapedobacter sp. 10938]|uniref:hypothetical protein n=1 Tax=Parapedobacter flavus TaxID=3110225 RepID=UPI002DB9CB15|nr:hypothetical protein [Parapedobacter sp. 10938]MEC3878244.1 hypothetical protein [Parapedobacter sp. 10938]
MDKRWYLAFLCNALAVSTMGQQNLQAMFKLGFPSTSNQTFFAEHPDIVRIVVDYKSEVPTSVAFVRHSDKEQVEPLSQEASRGYSSSLGYIDLPPLPKVAIDYGADITGLQDSNNYYTIQAEVTVDSIHYDFSHWYKPVAANATYVHTRPNPIARFAGNVLDLNGILSRKYRLPDGKAANDSVYNFGGAISEDGLLVDFRMSTGIPSEVSDMIGSKLQSLGDVWYREWDSRLHRRYQYMGIVCRINPNGRATLLTRRILRINGGRMPD